MSASTNTRSIHVLVVSASASNAGSLVVRVAGQTTAVGVLAGRASAVHEVTAQGTLSAAWCGKHRGNGAVGVVLQIVYVGAEALIEGEYVRSRA